ncbi:MAG: hypothetical protein ACK5UC_15380 [Planctomycetaceae bacterium]|jgi:hypothetical protein
MRELNCTGIESLPGLQSTPLCENDSLPLTTTTGVYDSPPATDPDHQLERTIQRVLQDLPGVIFDSLVIRRVPSGVCLQGYATIEDRDLDLGLIARGIDGVGDVIDRIVAIRRDSLPPR